MTDIVVCGHSGCGAMAALGAERSSLPPNLDGWLEYARPTTNPALFPASIGLEDDQVDTRSKRNVLLQMWSLLTYGSVAARLRDGRLLLHGWWFDIRGPSIQVLDSGQMRFVPFDEAFPEESASR